MQARPARTGKSSTCSQNPPSLQFRAQRLKLMTPHPHPPLLWTCMYRQARSVRAGKTPTWTQNPPRPLILIPKHILQTPLLCPYPNLGQISIHCSGTGQTTQNRIEPNLFSKPSHSLYSESKDPGYWKPSLLSPFPAAKPPLLKYIYPLLLKCRLHQSEGQRSPAGPKAMLTTKVQPPTLTETPYHQPTEIQTTKTTKPRNKSTYSTKTISETGS